MKQEYLDKLMQFPLFKGIEGEELLRLANCLDFRTLKFKKGETVVSQDADHLYAGLIIDGGVDIVRHDYYGNREFLSAVREGGLFGEVFALSGVEKFPVGVYANASSLILMFDCAKVYAPCAKACACHAAFMKNFTFILAGKSLAQNERLRILSKRTTKEKLIAFISDKAGGLTKSFAIDLDRQEMADYLAVERSAMCAVLSALKKEGIIDYRRDCFRFFPDKLKTKVSAE